MDVSFGPASENSINLVFPYGDRLLDARKELKAYLQKNQSLSYFRIKGDIEKLEPDNIIITPLSVNARFLFEGRLRVSVKNDL